MTEDPNFLVLASQSLRHLRMQQDKSKLFCDAARLFNMAYVRQKEMHGIDTRVPIKKINHLAYKFDLLAIITIDIQ